MSIYRGRTAREIYMANSLYDAIDDEDIDSINTFIAKGADCNLVLPCKGITPFHLIVGKENEEFAEKFTVIFLQYKADPNARTDDGLTSLHIAAAYGRYNILHALLCCGGNPDIRDNNRKKPIDYAYEHGWKKCIELLLSFMEKPEVLIQKDLDPSFNLTLEKIVVENCGNSRDYDIVQEYLTEIPKKTKRHESFSLLPETDTTEYVMKWCETYVKTEDMPNFANSSIKSHENGNDIHESSYDESDGGKSVPYKFKGDNIEFRKKYHKVRNKQCQNVTSRHIVGDEELMPKNERIDPCNGNLQNISNEVTNWTKFTTINEFSNESGIMTLPNSRNGWDLENENSQITVSDYRTCEEMYSNEISNDLSQFPIENVRNSTKSDDECSKEISFVSVSEIYKYIDEDEGVTLYEKRLLKTGTSDYAGSVISSSISSKVSSLPTSVDYDTDTLKRELTTHGYNPGPITLTTKRVYLRKLKQIKKHPLEHVQNKVNKKIYSVELEKTLRDSNWMKDTTSYKFLEETLANEFSHPNPSRKWRGGVNKTSFTYLLLDPRITNNLPCRAELINPKEVWEIFISSIFYVGKGKRSRPYSHLYESVRLWKKEKSHATSKKINHILDIWNDKYGVICLHIFQNVIPVEAYTREAAIISALKLENLKNIKGGEFYGIVSTWTQKQKKTLGVYLLYKAMMIFVNEGERQLYPSDIE